MKYSNVVRVKAKPGEFDAVVKIFSEDRKFDGLLQNFIIKTGNDTCCAVGVWESEDHIIQARPQMIEWLDSVRDKLEILSEDLGHTDPVSGPIVHER